MAPSWRTSVIEEGGVLGRPVRITVYDEGTAEKAITYYERAVTVDGWIYCLEVIRHNQRHPDAVSREIS
jgi:hypothetical protein